MQDFNRVFGRNVEAYPMQATINLRGMTGRKRPRVEDVLEATFVNLPPERVVQIDLSKTFIADKDSAVSSTERDRLLAALLATKWNKSEAARRMHWSRMTLYRKMSHHNIEAAPSHRNNGSLGRL